MCQCLGPLKACPSRSASSRRRMSRPPSSTSTWCRAWKVISGSPAHVSRVPNSRPANTPPEASARRIRSHRAGNSCGGQNGRLNPAWIRAAHGRSASANEAHRTLTPRQPPAGYVPGAARARLAQRQPPAPTSREPATPAHRYPRHSPGRSPGGPGRPRAPRTRPAAATAAHGRLTMHSIQPSPCRHHQPLRHHACPRAARSRLCRAR